jgi:hypothetical protein
MASHGSPIVWMCGCVANKRWSSVEPARGCEIMKHWRIVRDAASVWRRVCCNEPCRSPAKTFSSRETRMAAEKQFHQSKSASVFAATDSQRLTIT